MSQLNQVFSSLHTAAHNVKAKISTKKDESKLHARSKLLDHGPDMFVDLNIRFIGASGKDCICYLGKHIELPIGLPKMDVVGSAGKSHISLELRAPVLKS